jgi:hypothetical protein
MAVKSRKDQGLMPDSLLLDSDILIDHLRKDQKALEYLRREFDAGSLLFISVISRTEIFSGARRGEEETIQSLFDLLMPVEVDAAIADRAGEYLKKYAKSHMVTIGDAIIAATAGRCPLAFLICFSRSMADRLSALLTSFMIRSSKIILSS